MKRFRVETEFRRGERTCILETNDYARDTWMIDRLAPKPLELALLKLDEVETKMYQSLDRALLF